MVHATDTRAKHWLRHLRVTPVLAIVATVVVFGVPGSSAGMPELIPFDDAKMIIELNATDEDIGIQVFLDGESWMRVLIFGPDWRRLADIRAKGSVRELGVTELFFESEEPTLDELSLEEFKELFPEGEYRFIGVTTEGDLLFGTATFTHAIPDGPEIVSPAEGDAVDPDDAVIEWEPVADPDGSEIVGYQVIVEQEEPLRVFSVDLPASSTSITVPPGFFDPEISEYKFEVLAIEASGNQTITEQEFETE